MNLSQDQIPRVQELEAQPRSDLTGLRTWSSARIKSHGFKNVNLSQDQISRVQEHEVIQDQISRVQEQEAQPRSDLYGLKNIKLSQYQISRVQENEAQPVSDLER